MPEVNAAAAPDRRVVSDNTRTSAVFIYPVAGALIDYINRGLDRTGVQVTMPPDRERESLMAMLPEADILIGWGSDMQMLEAATKLKLFINPGAGISQHIDNFRELSKARDVVLANGHGNAYAVAQHTVALTLALANQVVPCHQRMVDGRGRQGGSATLYLNDITIGLLGYGAINKKVHQFLGGFDVRFAACRYGWDRDPGPFTTALSEYVPDQLSEFCSACDVIITALPTTRATKGMVTMRELKQLGANGLFVNVGRASAVVQEDIFRALKEGTIAGAAFDVWWGRHKDAESETTDRNDPYQLPFHELDNVVMSPHRAADSGGDMRRWDEVIENIERVHAGRPDLLNVVDLDLEY